MSKPILILLFAASASLAGAAVAADADPSMHQVYEAAQAGHLDQAQSMMAQVLKDHPESAKAHYVEAELDARQGKLAAARDEFQTAERIEPGLSFARPDSVGELRAQLFSQQQLPQQQQRMTPRYQQAPQRYVNAPAERGGGGHIPWGLLISLGLIGAIVWALLRRRQQVMMSPYGGNMSGGAPYGGGYGGGYPPPGGGSGLLGSLGTGLAVGAGVVAGEELAHHLLDGNGNRIVENGQPVVYQDDPANQNADMGGNDFGVNDSGSWDDNSGGGDFGGGGGDDSWS